MVPEQQSEENVPEQPSLKEGAPRDAAEPAPRQPTPVVGIGSSAGGLEALQAFLRNTPLDSGLAFVIVQHMDPTHKGAMVELLQRSTAMPVVEVTDNLVVQPNHVYVIPPNADLSILQGVLHVLPPVAPRGLRLPIDSFFRALALDRGDQSIGVILSGMGSDGTLGLRAIKEKAGMSFVQAPASAKFDGMPRSAIDAGLADVVAPVEELPDKIIAYRKHVFGQEARLESAAESRRQSDLDKIHILLRAQTGHDFSQYKVSTINRRIERRMGLHLIDKMSHYVRFLRENPKEIDLLFGELLIGVTNFFRDPEVWKRLEEEALPSLLAAFESGGTLRAWAPGCSTGEEAYSLGMVLLEALEKAQPARHVQVQIFATDLDQHAIEKARSGIYPDNIVADVSEERLQRFFVHDETGYRVRSELRERVVFAAHNLVMDPPFSRVDIVVCRNVLIYLNAELQQKLIRLFHRSLKSGGILFLGSSETVGRSDLFAPVDGKVRLYRRLESTLTPEPTDLPAVFPALKSAPELRTAPATAERAQQMMQMLVEQTLLQNHCPAAVLVNETGDILYISGRTGRYLEPTAGKANWNVFAMAREGLNHALHRAFDQVRRQRESVTLERVMVKTNGGVHAVDVTVRPFVDPGAMAGVLLIVLKDVASPFADEQEQDDIPHEGGGSVVQVEVELKRALEDLRATREEMQASQEELRSINEEWQSNNEELQSTNEELTSSKEEMQSMNEELQTLNSELKAKVDELSRVNNDLRNLLDSTQVAVLFLDDDLQVRRFTSQTAEIISLIPSDLGRKITDISSALIYPEMVADVRKVMSSLRSMERTVATREGSWFVVRVMPYRTMDYHVEGVVITFRDVTEAKQLELALRVSEERFRVAVARAGIAVASMDTDLRYTWLQTAFPDFDPAEALGKRDNELDHPLTNQAIQDLKKRVLKTGQGMDAQVQVETSDGAHIWHWSAEPQTNATGHVTGIVTAGVDITDRVRAECAQRESEERFRLLSASIAEGVTCHDAEGRIMQANPAAEHLLGLKWDGQPGQGAIPSRWPLVREDGSVVEEDQHPAMLALHGGQAVREVLLGVPGGAEGQPIWVHVDAEPLFREGQTAPHQVCTIYRLVGHPQLAPPTVEKSADDAKR
ncbi:MAG: chemotaxis protein CheB [Anaerolineae bacterium]